MMISHRDHTDWLAGRVPSSVRLRIRQQVELLGHVPYRQPLAVVTADGILLAANEPLLDLVGRSRDDLLGVEWDGIMPGWELRAAGWDRRGRRCSQPGPCS
jgi:hypothetical protein